MPTQVELPDGRLAEFPDTMSREDIKSVLQRKFPKPGPTFGEVINRPIEQVGSPTYAGPVDLARNQPPAVPGINWEEWNRLNQIPLTEERYTGVPSSAGITPEIIPSGRRLTEMVTGIPQQYAESFRQEVPALRALDIPMTLAASAGKAAIGLGEYLSSPQGVTELVLSRTPAKLLVLAKWAKDMAGGAYKEGAALGKLLVKPNKTQQDWQAISDHTVNAVAMALGTFGVTRQGVGEIRTLAKKLEMPEGKIQLQDRGPQIQAMEDAIKLQRPEGLGPFTRAQAPGEGPISMGVRTQPPLSPSAELGTPLFPAIGMKGQEVPLAPPIELQATFEPSGLRFGEPTRKIEIPPELALAEWRMMLENEARARAAQEAGSPFLREPPPEGPISMGLRTAPFPGSKQPSGRTFKPSGLEIAGPQIPPEAGAAQATQPPSPPIAPGARPAAATTKVRIMGEAAQRMADFEKALAEKVSQEQEARTHPDKPLTDNQLRIIQDSLTRALSDNQLKGKGGLVADGPLEAWADQVLGEVGPTPLHGGVPVKLAAAAAVKGAALLERGVRDAAKWAEEMVKQFGEGIRPMLSQIRQQADEVYSTASSGKTAMSRGNRVSEPTQWLVSRNGIGGFSYISENQRILHHGSGKATADTEALSKLENVSEVVEYDPNFANHPEVIGNRDFQHVVSNYVLNTLPPNSRAVAISQIGTSMKPNIPGVDYAKGGAAWITVRGAGDSISGTPNADGFVTSKGTWQRNYTPEQLIIELKKYFKNVSIVKGNTKSSKSVTAVASDYIGSETKGGEKNALYSEGSEVFRNVQQPEVTQEGAGRVPADEGRPQAPEARQEITQPKGGVERGQKEKGQEKEVRTEPIESIESLPAIENGGRIAIILPNGKAVVGGRIHADTWNKAVEKGAATDAELSSGFAGFVKPDGSAWGVNGKQLPNVTEVIIVGREAPKLAIERLRPSAPVTEAPGKTTIRFSAKTKDATTQFNTAKTGNDFKISTPDGSNVTGYLDGEIFYVESKVKGKGIGSSLMKDALALLASRGNETVIMRVAGTDAGKALVSKMVNDGYISSALETKPSGTTVHRLLTDASGNRISGSIISKLESLKFPETGEGQLYSLPHPDAIIKIGKQAWNDALDAAIAAVKAGRVVGDAIEEALKLIRDRNPRLDESKLRTNLGFIFRTEEQALGVKPETTTVRYPVEGENVEMRKSAERATTSEMIPEPVQRRIESAPESFYNQQVGDQVRDLVNAMKDSDLAAVPRDSNIYVAARLTQALRLFRAGKYDAGYNIFVELEKEGTRMGQLLNQFKMLRGSRPEDVVQIINNKLKKSGRDVLNSSQQKMAVELFAKNQLADRNLEIATDAWKLDPSDAKAAKAEAALTDANKAAIELQRFASKYDPKGFFDILKSILQGTLLTPISEVANLVGNLGFLQGRQGTRTVATGFDILDSYLRGRKRSITVQPIRGTIEAFKGAGRGALEIPEIFKRGTGDVIKGETRSGLHPMQAWINLFSKNPEMPTVGGRIKLQDRLNLLLEGTFGIPAEMMLRGLGAGDIIFKEAARARATATELKLANVPKSKWAFAQKFPELFLDDAALERIHQETLGAVFQRSSKSLNFLTRFIRGRGSFLDFAAATVAPYKLTPWNIVGESLSYNPVVAFSRALYDFKRGETRSGKINAGKFLVGSMIATAGWWLYRNGLLAPSMDQKDEAQKARLAAREILPPNHINLSGLNRAFDKFAKGEKPTFADTDFRPGDKTIDIFRAGGLMGSIFYMTANIGRDFEKKPEVPNSEIWLAILRQSTLEQARFGMNQSFLSGVEGFLSAIREGNTDDYARQWLNTLISIPLANSLTTMSRTMREYKPELRADTFHKQVENIVRNRLGIANLDEYLPLKRGLWGEPLPETPKDRNAIIYHFFDVFKGQQVTDDPVSIMIYKLYRETSNTKVIPSIVSKNLIVKSKNYPLSPERQSRLAELVGTERRRIVDKVVINPKFHQLSNEGKIELLDKIYDAGLKIGKKNFLEELAAKGEVLEPKPAKAGFRPVEAE